MVYHALLNDKIACEQNGTDFFCPSEDRRLLHKMFDEINHQTGSDIHYLAQIDSFIIPGAGRIVEKYILDFTSESVKCYLIPQMIADKITDCDKLLLQLYLHFRRSKEYISEPGQPAPAHIYVRYDNAFKTLRSRRIENELITVVCNPRDAFYLPLTVNMLASWKNPEMFKVLAFYLTETDFVGLDIGDTEAPIYPPKQAMIRELRFSAIDGLRYYPTKETEELLSLFTASKDSDICSAAKRTLKSISRKRKT